MPAADNVRLTLLAMFDGPLRLCDTRTAAKVTFDLATVGYVMPPDRTSPVGPAALTRRDLAEH